MGGNSCPLCAAYLVIKRHRRLGGSISGEPRGACVILKRSATGFGARNRSRPAAEGYGPGGVQNDGTLVIGTSNGTNDTTSPIIQAKKYGVNSTIAFSVYDGIIKGKVNAINDIANISTLIPSTNIEPGTSEVIDSETIGSDTYETLYYELISGYRITFSANGGEVIPSSKVVGENEPAGSLPTPTRTGYVFGGWYNPNNQLVNENTIVDSDITYTARWVESVLLANITNEDISLTVNQTETINVTNTANIESFTYSSNDTGVATVSAGGTVTAIGPGITQISLTGNQSGEVKHVIVTVDISNEIETFDIMPTPMRTYFNNIDIWAANQTDSNHTNYDTYMNNNLSTNDCINFNVDDRQNKSTSTGTQYCDLPNQYDTNVSGTVNVYEYNPTTNTVIRQATYASVKNGKIYNLIPNTTYYWESASDSTQHGKFYAFGERRIITIDNLKSGSSDTYYQTRNVRDLGGIKVSYENAQGNTVNGTIKYGKLFRGEKIWGGNGDSVQYFTKLGINHEMDLRADSEPVIAEEDVLSNKIIKSGSSKTYEIIHYGIDYNENLSNYTLARNAVLEVMNEFITAYNNNEDYSLYFHCRIGADRTGTLAYILEGLLGVSQEDRYRDYEMSVFFGLDERTRFYYNKGSNTTKFVYMKQAMRNASQNGTEDVIAWFLQGSSNQAQDMATIQTFRSIMVDVNS